MFVDQLTKDLATSLRAIMTMDVRGHRLQDRLQFTTPGRNLLYPARDALASFDARIAAPAPALVAEIPRWQDKFVEYGEEYSEISCAQDEIKALREALDATQTQAHAPPAMTPHYQVWQSADACAEFWSWDDVDRAEYDAAMPDKRRVLYALDTPPA